MNNQEETYLPHSDVDFLFEEIERGRQGLNLGLPMGFPDLDRFVGGIQKGRYDLVFAQEKAGKSAFVNSAYILNPYESLRLVEKTENLKVHYFSLEMSKSAVLSKWLADIYFQRYDELIDPSLIMSRSKKLPDSVYERLVSIRRYLDEMLHRCVTIHEGPHHPTAIKIAIDTYAKSCGRFERGRYIPNNPDQTVIIIVDTAGNLTLERVEGIASMKTTIDKQSEYNRYFRNNYNYNVCMVMHSNRDVADFQREKSNDIFPKKSDIKESNQPIQDCNLCYCIFDPTPYFDRLTVDLTKVCDGYEVLKIGKRFRMVGILANRDGEAYVRKGMLFYGETGRFRELPKPSEINDTFYRKLAALRKLT